MIELTVPTTLAQSHESIGGRGLRRWVEYLGVKEVIRVMFGLEPAGENGRVLGHISVSVAESPDANEPPSRRPTDEEFKAALDVLPSKLWVEGKGGDPLMRHAWTR